MAMSQPVDEYHYTVASARGHQLLPLHCRDGGSPTAGGAFDTGAGSDVEHAVATWSRQKAWIQH